MPGVDLKLLNVLSLRPSVSRVMLYSLGCYAGGTVLRIAKDIAENNPGARVLVVCRETTIPTFQAPSEDNPVYLVSNAIFADGAAAMIIGAAWPRVTTERPIFQIISASQSAVPDSNGMIQGHYREVSVTMQISEKVPELISGDLEDNLVKLLARLRSRIGTPFSGPHTPEGGGFLTP
ncbi:hypothetical protein NL676_035189 [Syzygium grande]|nr:hypothetical protein NL676_035189 [Syzygium grande]